MSDLSAFSLETRRIAVPGANTGLRQAIAVAIARAGGEAVAGGRSSLAETAGTVASGGGRIVSVSCDLADTAALKNLIGEIWQSAGPLDVLVNNAGIIRRADSVELSEADWDDVVDLNLKATFMLSQAFARHAMAENRPGRIVNIASVSGLIGVAGQANYCASKAGLIGLTRSLAVEFASRGVRCNAVAPGFIETDMTRKLNERRVTQVLERIPMRRFGQGREVARVVAFLLSQDAAYMTGQVLAVDGGRVA